METIKKVYADKYSIMIKELEKLNKYNITFHEPKVRP